MKAAVVCLPSADTSPEVLPAVSSIQPGWHQYLPAFIWESSSVLVDAATFGSREETANEQA